MVHHGINILKVARSKGYNKSKLAKEYGKSSPSVDYDMKREVLDLEVLKKYAEILNVSVSEFQKETTESRENQEDYKDKYFKLLETTNYLWQVVSQNGIKVDLGKFNVINWHVVTPNFFVRGN